MLDKAILGIIYGLVIWRVAHMIQSENGPFAIFGRIQERVARMKNQRGGFKEMFFCFNCMSIWLAFIISLFISKDLLQLVLNTLTLSAISIIIDSIVE